MIQVPILHFNKFNFIFIEHIIITSGDGNIEIFQRNEDLQIYKKLLRVAKKNAKKKRLHSEMEEKDQTDSKLMLKVNKEKIKEKVAEGDYDAKYLFGSICYLLVGDSKVRSSRIIKHKKQLRLITALHTNDMFVYSLTLEETTGHFVPEKLFSLGQENHRSALRCVAMSDNDTVFLTSSMDSVKVWNVEERK